MKRTFRILPLLLVTLATACGPAGQHFHGTYSLSGTTTLTLTGYGSETGQLTGTRRFLEGAVSDLVLADPDGHCLLPADVEGDVATFRPGSSCTQVVDGVTVTRTLSNGTASLSGKVVQVYLFGNMTALYQGRTVSGSFSENSTLTRIAQ
jgi:hypothetical protein